jgi:hypothetical protein
MKSHYAFKSTKILGIALLLINLNSHAETASDSSIKEFFKASGQEAQYVEAKQVALPAFRQIAKDMPEDLFNELARTDNIFELVTPIYRKHFSEEEILELIAFYKTPIGKKYAALSGQIQREGMEASARRAQMTIMNYQIQKGNFTIESPKK